MPRVLRHLLARRLRGSASAARPTPSAAALELLALQPLLPLLLLPPHRRARSRLEVARFYSYCCAAGAGSASVADAGTAGACVSGVAAFRRPALHHLQPRRRLLCAAEQHFAAAGFAAVAPVVQSSVVAAERATRSLVARSWTGRAQRARGRPPRTRATSRRPAPVAHVPAVPRSAPTHLTLVIDRKMTRSVEERLAETCARISQFTFGFVVVESGCLHHPRPPHAHAAAMTRKRRVGARTATTPQCAPMLSIDRREQERVIDTHRWQG